MTKEDLLAELVESGCLQTPSLIRAFEKVDRRDFVAPEFEREAYEDYPLPIGFGQTISQPKTVAFMLELLSPKPGERILEIGAGSGWLTALLATAIGDGISRLARRQRSGVVSVERIPELKDMAFRNVSKYGFIESHLAEIVLADGAKGYPRRAPFDKVIAAAAGEAVPVAWKNQLLAGGRIVAPVGHTILVLDKITSADWTVREYGGFRFVPLVSNEGDG